MPRKSSPAPTLRPGPSNAPTAKPGPLASLPVARLESYLAKQDKAKALAKELDSLKGEVDAESKDLLDAVQAGARAPVGWAVGVQTKEAKNTSWKSEALALAARAGLDPKTYESEVRERTQTTVTISLSVTRLQK